MQGRKADIGAALIVLALAAGCADGDAEPVAPVSSTTTSAAPVPETTGGTAAPAPTPTLPPPPRCPAGPIGTSVDEAASLEADFDGDGGPDVAMSYLTDPEWRVRIDFADGGAVEEVLPTQALDDAHVEVARDLDGDGRAELWLQVATGASASIVALYRLDGCDLEPVLLDGVPATFAIGGPVLLLQGLACGDATVTHLGATSEDGESFTTLDLTYELRAGELVRTGDESGTLSADDPDLPAYSSFDC